VFDLLYLDGKDLRGKPLLERKALLEKILPNSPLLLYSAHVADDGVKAFTRAKRAGEEGVMAKLANGRYHSGQRTREWLKVKASQEQEVVIVGFTQPKGQRRFFGSLVLAVRDGKSWKYAGRAGTGFTQASLRELHGKLVPLITKKKPIAEKVPSEASTIWVKPKLVAEVRFTEWTAAGEMRHPVFLGLRTDKKATDVTREMPKPLSEAKPKARFKRR
jgi:bifunctional non-homologous end joining protein LigD